MDWNCIEGNCGVGFKCPYAISNRCRPPYITLHNAIADKAPACENRGL